MVEGPATDAAFAILILVLGGLIVGGFAVICHALRAAPADPIASGDDQCIASRRANITANIPQERPRRIVVSTATTAMADYAVPRPCDVDAIRENSYSYDLAALTAPAEPELPRVVPVTPVVEQEHGIAVAWPTQVVQPVPLTRL